MADGIAAVGTITGALGGDAADRSVDHPGLI